jgi:hypothetical protein
MAFYLKLKASQRACNIHVTATEITPMIRFQDALEELKYLDEKAKDQISLLRALANFNIADERSPMAEDLKNQRTQLRKSLQQLENDLYQFAEKCQQKIEESGSKPVKPAVNRDITDLTTEFIRMAVPPEAQSVWRPNDFTGSLLVFFVNGKIDSSSLLEKKNSSTEQELTDDTPANDSQDGVKVVIEPRESFSVFKAPVEAKVNIYFSLPEPAAVVVKIFDKLDRVVRQLDSQYDAPGTYTIEWDGLDDQSNAVPKDTYYCQLQIGNSLSELKTIDLS